MQRIQLQAHDRTPALLSILLSLPAAAVGIASIVVLTSPFVGYPIGMERDLFWYETYETAATVKVIEGMRADIPPKPYRYVIPSVVWPVIQVLGIGGAATALHLARRADRHAPPIGLPLIALVACLAAFAQTLLMMAAPFLVT